MNFDGRRIGVARFAAILPGVGGLRRLDKEPRRGDVATLLGYHRDTAPGTVVAQNMLVVVPKDVSWWLRAEVYGARQIYRASRANVQIRPTEYRRCRYCDEKGTPLSFPFPLSFPSRKYRFFFPPTCARVKRREGEILFEKRGTLERRTRERFTDLAPTNETKTFHSRAKVIAIEITRPSFVSRSPKLGSRISLSPSFSFSFFRRTRSIERSEV